MFVERRTTLRINGRDHTKLINGVENQIDYVRTALSNVDTNSAIDVAGALCFPDVGGLPLVRRVEVRGILADGPKRVARPPARAGSLEPGIVQAIWSTLARAFPTA